MRRRLISILLFFAVSAAAMAAQSGPRGVLLALAKNDRTLSVVDPATLHVLARYPSGPDPHEVIASSDGKLAFISNYGFGQYRTISVIDLASHKTLPPIDLGVLSGPHGLFFAGGKLYFTAEVNKVIGRYDPTARKIDWLLGTGQNRTHMIFVSPGLDRIYTSNVSSGTVSLIEETMLRPGGPPPSPSHGAGPPPGAARPDWNETVLPAGPGSEGFDVSPDGRELWVASAGAGVITVIDLRERKVAQTLNADVRGANRLKFTPDGKLVFVSSLQNGNVTVMDVAARRPIKRIPVGHGAGGILMEPGGARAFVACSPDNSIAVIDLKTLAVVGRIDVGKNPDGLAWAVSR